MKTYLILGIVLMFTINQPGYGQPSDVNPEVYPIQKQLLSLPGNVYVMTITDQEGDLLQKGTYLKVDNRLIPHGIWRIYDTNTHDLVTKSEYNNGIQKWVETTIDGAVVRYNQQDIELNKLHKRIAKLEKQVNS